MGIGTVHTEQTSLALSMRSKKTITAQKAVKLFALFLQLHCWLDFFKKLTFGKKTDLEDCTVLK